MKCAPESKLTEREQVAVRFAELLITNPKGVDDAFLARLHRHYKQDEIPELAFHTMYMNIYHCFRTAIQLEPLKGEELVIDEIPYRLQPAPEGVSRAPLGEIRGELPAPLAHSLRQLLPALWTKSSLETPLKELIRFKLAQLADYRAGVRYRVLEAREQGVTEVMLAQVADPGRSTLPEREKLTLQFVELLTTQPAAITEPSYKELRLHFSEVQLVEVMFFTLAYNSVYRFNSALERGEEPKLKVESVRVYGETVTRP